MREAFILPVNGIGKNQNAYTNGHCFAVIAANQFMPGKQGIENRQPRLDILSNAEAGMFR